MKSKFSFRSFLSILVLLFLFPACGSFNSPATLTSTSTRTPKPTLTLTFTPTPVLPDISNVIIKYEDLPSNFYIENTTESTRTVKRYIFATVERNQVIQGMTFIISANDGQEKINSYFEDPKKLLDSMFKSSATPFTDITINPNTDTYGERSAIFSGTALVNDLQVRGEFIFIQKGDIAVLISTYYPQASPPDVPLDSLARLMEERMNAVAQ